MHSMNHEHSAEGIPISQTVTKSSIRYLTFVIFGNYILEKSK
jgi:hypothetical protein